jgi:hypothetical protein
MSTLSEILKEEYSKQSGLSQSLNLVKMIEEVVSAISILGEDDAPDAVPKDDAEAIEMVLKMIPNIEVSEIGWSDVRTNEDGTEIKGAQRKLLEDYLKNIQGNDFASKIQSVSGFYDNGVEMVVEQSGEDRTKRIVQAISYLVFYKTLTKVITNFNASSAGFSFESFLAALVNGEQIPTGNQTIADYLDRASGETIPVSLKLYKEGNLEVGGSYTDLVNDMVNPTYPRSINGGMRYVICTKEFDKQEKGSSPLEQEGKINFYQFDFNLANVADILLSSKYPYVIRMPRQVLSALAAGQQVGATELLNLPTADKSLSAEELTPLFRKALEQVISQYPEEDPIRRIRSEALDNLMNALNWEKNDDIFNQNKVRGRGGLSKSSVKRWVANAYESAPEVHTSLASAIVTANEEVVKSQAKKAKKSERNQQIEDMIKNDEFLSPEASARAYKNLGVAQKKQALLSSYGYLRTLHFALNQTQSTNQSEPTNTQFVGSIKIGRAEVKNVVDRIRDILNDEVTEIFQSLKILSDSLNSFFAGGLKDDSLAGKSISNATNISSKDILKTDNSDN